MPYLMRTETYALLKRLETYPVFTLDDLCIILDKDMPYCRLLVHRLARKGLVHHIQRDRYTMHDDPMIIASRLIFPSYVSLWSALRFHDMTTQLPQDISVVTSANRYASEIEHLGSKIIFYKVPAEYMFGYSKVRMSGFDVFIADKEKTMLDSILLKKISLTELRDLLYLNRKDLSLMKLVKYALIADNRSACKRLGWLLQDIGSSTYRSLKGHVGGAFIPLDYARPAKGPLDRDWRVQVNMEVIG